MFDIIMTTGPNFKKQENKTQLKLHMYWSKLVWCRFLWLLLNNTQQLNDYVCMNMFEKLRQHLMKKHGAQINFTTMRDGHTKIVQLKNVVCSRYL